MMLKSLIIGAGLPLSLAQSLDFNCASFWPSLAPGDSFTVNANCRMYPGWPKVIGQTTVSVIHTNSWQGNLGIIDELLNEAITESVALYGNLVPPPDLVIILGSSANEDAALDAWMPTFPEGPCQIRSFEGWAMDEALSMTPGAMQAVAHEIYHCVQHKMLGSIEDSSASIWVLESSADYFSNLVFPKANREWESSSDYLPDVPIWEQKYEANLWFQSLERSRGMVYLHQWVMGTIFAGGPDDERGRLASLSGFANDFFLFARDFSLDRIIDSGGDVVPIQNLPDPGNVVWSVNQDETEGTTVLELKTFTISEFTTQFDAGQNIKLYASTKGNQRMAWRLEGDSFWSDVSGTASSGGSQGVVTIPCANGPATLRILVVSAENKAADKVELSFVQQYKDENCCKKGSRKRAATSACPTSTRPTSTATEPEPTETSSGSCAGSSIEMDPCLTSNSWSLDLPSTQALLKKKLSELPEVTINGVRVNGAGGLNFDDNKVAFTYKSFSTNVDVTAEGLSLPIGVTIDGSASGLLFITSGGDGFGKACIAFKSGSGTAKAIVPFAGEIDFDLTPGGGYIMDMTIEYTCNSDSLTIVSAVGDPLSGGPSWGPFAYNAA